VTTDPSSRAAREGQSITVIRQRLHEALPNLRTRHAVEQLWLFGSRVRCEEGTDSDLDVLVEFGEIPSLFGVIRLENELSELLGVRVDLVMKSALKPRIGEAILREVVPV
jgi:uncharacterized protein